MYDMYPASWRVVDDTGNPGRKAHRQRRTDRERDREAVQEAMNRRDNGGEPTQ
jgi:hypothetical protein